MTATELREAVDSAKADFGVTDPSPRRVCYSGLAGGRLRWIGVSILSNVPV